MESKYQGEGRPEYPLANDIDGNPIEIPKEAVAWRVSKMPAKAGRPRVLTDARKGGPLEVPLTTPYRDFLDEVGEAGSGRYRLEATDHNRRVIPGCVAFVEIVVDDEGPSEEPMAVGEALREALRCVAQLADANARVMQALGSAFGNVRPAQAQIELPPTTSAPEQQSQIGQQIFAAVQQALGMMDAAKKTGNGAGA